MTAYARQLAFQANPSTPTCWPFTEAACSADSAPLRVIDE